MTRFSAKELGLTEQISNGKRGAKRPAKQPRTEQPGWVHGLRQLYDSTVNEPLPDSFEELLRKLDSGDDKKA